MRLEEAIELIQLEYREMPELRLTFRQARRLWDFSPDLCELALACLISRGFLAITADGHYARTYVAPRSSNGVRHSTFHALVRSEDRFYLP
jgi:hypothetical protein